MSYSERDLTADFSRFRRKDPKAAILQFTFAIEFKLKHNKEKLNLLQDFQAQQIPSLLQASQSCIYHKISDQSMQLKPFDSLQICYSPAFVGVMWYKLRQPKVLYLIHINQIEDWLKKEYNKITEEDAKQAAIFTFIL